MNHHLKDLSIQTINIELQDQAKQLVLEGLSERFGFLDESLNPDLDNIINNYIDQGSVFLVGLHQSIVVCTGAFVREDEDTARLVRMSVAKHYRRKGYAKAMMRELERQAIINNYKRIVLETNNTWTDAIEFYKSSGYKQYDIDEVRIHMCKLLG